MGLLTWLLLEFGPVWPLIILIGVVIWILCELPHAVNQALTR